VVFSHQSEPIFLSASGFASIFGFADCFPRQTRIEGRLTWAMEFVPVLGEKAFAFVLSALEANLCPCAVLVKSLVDGFRSISSYVRNRERGGKHTWISFHSGLYFGIELLFQSMRPGCRDFIS